MSSPGRDGAAAPARPSPPIVRRVRGYIQSYGDGRTCADAKCSTTLSRYNEDDLCWRHAEQRDAGRVRRP